MDAANAMSVGLVLGAGGRTAEAWHAGVASALHEAAGWDARSAELIAGTSAGAITGLCLRAGIPPADLHAMQCGQPLSDEAKMLLDRIVTPYSEDRRERSWAQQCPQSPTLSARALWPPWKARPVHAAVGLLPRGTLATEALGQRLTELHPEPWPSARFWVAAVRLSDGERVVFGRDDTEATVAEAVRASCAVPARYEPVTVGGHQYVDGGLHSSTNADLMGPPAFDAVVVSSVMSGDPGWSEVGAGLSRAWSEVGDGLSRAWSSLGDGLSRAWSSLGDGIGLEGQRGPRAGEAWWLDAVSGAWSDGRAVRAGRRQWMDDKLREEVDGLRRRGIKVLVVEPDTGAVDRLDGPPGDDEDTRRAEIAALGYEATRRALAEPGPGDRLAALLRRASA